MRLVLTAKVALDRRNCHDKIGYTARDTNKNKPGSKFPKYGASLVRGVVHSHLFFAEVHGQNERRKNS